MSQQQKETLGGCLILVIAGLVIVGVIGFWLSSQNQGDDQAQAQAVPDRQQAQAIDPRELSAEPDKYKGGNVVLHGEAVDVSQEESYTYLRLSALAPNVATASQLVDVELRPKEQDILPENCYRVYGVVVDNQHPWYSWLYTPLPAVRAYAIESRPTGVSGGCDVP